MTKPEATSSAANSEVVPCHLPFEVITLIRTQNQRCRGTAGRFGHDCAPQPCGARIFLSEVLSHVCQSARSLASTRLTASGVASPLMMHGTRQQQPGLFRLRSRSV